LLLSSFTGSCILALQTPTAGSPARLRVQIHLPVRPMYKIGDICTAFDGMGLTVCSLARLRTVSKVYQFFLRSSCWNSKSLQLSRCNSHSIYPVDLLCFYRTFSLHPSLAIPRLSQLYLIGPLAFQNITNLGSTRWARCACQGDFSENPKKNTSSSSTSSRGSQGESWIRKYSVLCLVA